jgi:ferredoxin-like protein FixX
MALWFLRGLRRGVVTTRYPRQADRSSLDLPTPPAFRSRELSAGLARRLVAVCPSGALQTSEGAMTVDLGACTGCGRCLDVAGDAARPSGHWELATWERSALVRCIPIGGDDDE